MSHSTQFGLFHIMSEFWFWSTLPVFCIQQDLCVNMSLSGNRLLLECMIDHHIRSYSLLNCSLLDIPICTIDEQIHTNISTDMRTCLVDCSQISHDTLQGYGYLVSTIPLQIIYREKQQLRPMKFLSKPVSSLFVKTLELCVCVCITLGHIEVEMRTQF